MLKITEIDRNEGRVAIRLEGRIPENCVNEVREYCRSELDRGFGITLDVADISFASRGAISLFHELLDRDVTFVNCSPFLNDQLKVR